MQVDMIEAATSFAGGSSGGPLHRPRVTTGSIIARKFAADRLQMQQTDRQQFNFWSLPESRAP